MQKHTVELGQADMEKLLKLEGIEILHQGEKIELELNQEGYDYLSRVFGRE